MEAEASGEMYEGTISVVMIKWRDVVIHADTVYGNVATDEHLQNLVDETKQAFIANGCNRFNRDGIDLEDLTQTVLVYKLISEANQQFVVEGGKISELRFVRDHAEVLLGGEG